MIIISARESFNNPDRLTPCNHAIRRIDLNSGKTIETIASIHDLLVTLGGKKVLLLLHGYNTRHQAVYDAYAVIEQQVNEHLREAYDVVIGYSWPGGNHILDWWDSKKRANRTADYFSQLLAVIAPICQVLDIMSHSLGARVVLKALSQGGNKPLIRHYYCTAPAVDNEVFEKGGEFHGANQWVKSLFVFHSRRDGILASAYRVAELDNALGLYGPEDTQYIVRETRNLFIANCKYIVREHSGYKHCSALYQYMASAQVKEPDTFLTL